MGQGEYPTLSAILAVVPAETGPVVGSFEKW